MNPWLLVVPALFALAIYWIVRRSRKAGSRQVSEAGLETASPLVRVTREDPGRA